LAALFYTCPVNYNDPEVGQAVVKVLEHNGIEVAIVEERCCGQPFDVTEYLMRLERDGTLNKEFRTDLGKVAYHMPCHLKYQAIGQQTLELLRLMSSDVVFVDKGCSGMDGTWGMKKQYFEPSLRVARGLCEGMMDAQPATCVTDCALSALQIRQGTGLKAVHPYQLLAEAYGL